jgi:predicted amidophosphoribosyltransferase
LFDPQTSGGLLYSLPENEAYKLEIPLKTNVLVKAFESKNQSLLGRNERLSNVKDVFKVDNAEIIYNKNILIIDDIVTTGSTLNQCSKVLKQAGACSVVAGVLATTRNY